MSTDSLEHADLINFLLPENSTMAKKTKLIQKKEIVAEKLYIYKKFAKKKKVAIKFAKKICSQNFKASKGRIFEEIQDIKSLKHCWAFTLTRQYLF